MKTVTNWQLNEHKKVVNLLLFLFLVLKTMNVKCLQVLFAMYTACKNNDDANFKVHWLRASFTFFIVYKIGLEWVP